VPIRDIGRKVLQSSFGECAKRDIGQNVLSLLLVTVPNVTLDGRFYSLLLVNVPIRDIGQKVLQSSFGNLANT